MEAFQTNPVSLRHLLSEIRIWSQDWFEDKEREAKRVEEAYGKALAADETGLAATSAEEAPPAAIPAKDPYRPQREGPLLIPRANGRSITEYTETQLASLIRWIESDGLLRTKAELREEAIEALGYRRRGPRIIVALDEAIELARARQG